VFFFLNKTHLIFTKKPPGGGGVKTPRLLATGAGV
jgi:hypothetical protein